MFNTVYSFISRVIEYFNEENILFIALAAILGCLILGLFFMLFSRLNREKRNYKRYNKHISKNGLKSRGDFNSLNALIIKKRTQTTIQWELCYPHNTCVLVQPNVPAFHVRRTRRCLFFALGFIAVTLLVFSIYAIFQPEPGYIPYLIIPALTAALIFLMEGCFSFFDGCAVRKLEKEKTKFHISVTKALLEVLGIRTCVCCCTSGTDHSEATEKPTDKTEKKSEKEETPEPVKEEKKPTNEVVSEKKPEKKKAEPKQKKDKPSSVKKDEPKKEEEENESKKAKPVVMEEKPAIVHAPTVKKKPVKKPYTKPEPVVEKEEELIIIPPPVKITPAPSPQPFLIPEPIKTERNKPASKPTPKPVSKPSKPVLKKEPQPEPKPTPKPEPRITPKPQPKAIATPKPSEIKAKNVDDRMAELSARLGTLRSTIVETTVEETVEKQVFESVTVGGQTTTNASSTQSIEVSATREVSNEAGDVTSRYGAALGATRTREFENGEIKKDDVIIRAAALPEIKPKEQVGLYGTPKTIAAPYTAPKAPAVNKAKSPAPAKTGKYNQDEVMNALLGLRSAMNKQQNVNDDATF